MEYKRQARDIAAGLYVSALNTLFSLLLNLTKFIKS